MFWTALLRGLGALLRGLCLLLGLRYLALKRLQLLLQSIDLALHLIGLRILRERRRRHEDRCENGAGQQQPGALFDDHHPLLFWPKRKPNPSRRAK